jgi:hypothetical protein
MDVISSSAVITIAYLEKRGAFLSLILWLCVEENYRKAITVDGTNVTINIVDTAGQVRFSLPWNLHFIVFAWPLFKYFLYHEFLFICFFSALICKFASFKLIFYLCVLTSFPLVFLSFSLTLPYSFLARIHCASRSTFTIGRRIPSRFCNQRQKFISRNQTASRINY